MFCFCGPGAADADPARDFDRLAQAEHASTALCAIGRSENAARLISWPPKPIPLDGAHPVRMRAVRSMQRQRAAWLMDRYGFAHGARIGA